MEKRIFDQGGCLHSGRGKRALVQGAVPLHDTVRRDVGGGYSGQNTAIPFRLQAGIGLAGIDSGIGPACHARGPRGVLALQPVHVCDVPSRDGQHPSLRVCDACLPHVAYRGVLCQHHDKREQDDNGPLSLTFAFAVTIRTAPGLLEFLKKRKKNVIDQPMECNVPIGGS